MNPPFDRRKDDHERAEFERDVLVHMAVTNEYLWHQEQKCIDHNTQTKDHEVRISALERVWDLTKWSLQLIGYLSAGAGTVYAGLSFLFNHGIINFDKIPK